MVKNLPANAGDVKVTDSIPGSRRSPEGGHRNPLQYSSLEDPWTTVHRIHGLQSIGSQRVGHDQSDLACTYRHLLVGSDGNTEDDGFLTTEQIFRE